MTGSNERVGESDDTKSPADEAAAPAAEAAPPEACSVPEEADKAAPEDKPAAPSADAPAADKPASNAAAGEGVSPPAAHPDAGFVAPEPDVLPMQDAGKGQHAAPTDEPTEHDDAVDEVAAKPAEEPPAKPAEEPAADAAAAPEEAVSAADPAPAEAAEPAAEAPAVEPEAPVIEEPPAPLPAPRILGIEPAHGPLSGGSEIVVTGEAFSEGALVLIDGIEAETTRESGTSLRAKTRGRGGIGFVDVRVVNADGQNEVRINGYHYDPPPQLLRAEPDVVPVQGGATVVLYGMDFVDGCQVRIGEKLLPSIFVDKGRVEAIATAHPVGEVDVELKNPDGQISVLERALRFDDPPVITSVVPMEGSVAGGTEVTITGRGFVPGCKVVLAGEPVAEVIFNGETELRFTTPRQPVPLPVDLTVVNPSGLEHRAARAFLYKPAAPRILEVSPAYGPNAGGARVTLSGQDFSEGVSVFICGISAAVTFKGTTELEIVTPAVSRDGLVDLRVVNRDDQAHTFEKAYRYDAPLEPPVLNSVSPNKGSQVGGLKVAVLGDQFVEATQVRFGGVAAAVRFLTRKELEVVTPAYAGSGEVAVEVVNPDGVTATLENGFTFEAKPAPTISSVTPKNGPTTGGTKLVIEGTNFTKTSFVYVGRELPKDVQVKSATEIHVITMPRKAAGLVDVEVGGPDVVKAVMKNAYSYDAVPAPTITSVSPNAGGVGGGTEVSISGKNFIKETIVLVDGKPAKSVKLVDKATLEFKTPPGDANKMADIIVRNPDGKEAVQKRAFLYDPRYR